MVGGRGGVVVEMSGGQSVSGEELSTHCGAGEGSDTVSDTVSAQEKKTTIIFD